MRVRMLCGQAGPVINRVPGKVYEIEDGEAERLIAAGAAELPNAGEPTGDPPPVKRGRGRPRKTAIDQPSETAELAEPDF